MTCMGRRAYRKAEPFRKRVDRNGLPATVKPSIAVRGGVPLRIARALMCSVLLSALFAVAGSVAPASAATTGNNGTIVFTGTPHAGQTDLWEVSAGGKGLLNVTKRDGLYDS